MFEDIWQLILKQPYGLCSIEGEGGEGAGGESGAGGGDGSGNGDGAGAGSEEGAAGAGAAKSEPLTKDAIALIVSEQMKPLHEKIGELTSENVNLRGAIRQQRQEPREVKAEPVKETPVLTKDEFLAAMNADPVATIRKIIMDTTTPEIEKRVSSATSGVKQESEARDAFMRDAEGDRTNALSVSTAFGNETPKDPEYAGSLREEFDKMGDQELRAIASHTQRAISNWRFGIGR